MLGLAFALLGCHRLLPFVQGGPAELQSDGARLDQLLERRPATDRGVVVAELGPPPKPGLDPTFADHGVAIVDGPVTPGNDYAAAAAIDSQQRVVVVGQISMAVNPKGVHNKDLAIWRFLDGGQPDPSFASGGRGIYHFGSYNWDYGRNLVITASDGIVVGGNVDWGMDEPTLWTFTAAGALDPGFGAGGVSHHGLGAEVQGTDMVLDPIRSRYVLLGNQSGN